MQTGENCLGETAQFQCYQKECYLSVFIDDKNAIINNYSRLKYYNLSG